jgi:hypothetical protein
MKLLTAAALLALLACGPVLAQAPTPPASRTTPQAPATTEAIQGVGNFITRQGPGQWRVEDLEEMTVYTPDGKGIGEIEDVLVDQSGRLIGYIIEVGGFLGINEKRIAVAPGALELQQPAANGAGRDGVRILMRLGRDELEKAPAFRSAADR